MDQLLEPKGKEINEYLNEGTRSCHIGNEQSHIICTLMGIQPINQLFGHLDEQCPILDCSAELEVGRTGIGDMHKNMPEHHAYT